jgi:hypothetical protein
VNAPCQIVVLGLHWGRMVAADFREIAHCGAKFTVTTRRDEKGERQIQLGVHHSSVGPAGLFGVFALQQGIPVGTIQLAGIGPFRNSPPFPHCLNVFVASDSEGRFGHECPQCHQYWRSSGPPTSWPMTCPYCGMRSMAHQCLSRAQRAYIEACCDLIVEAMNAETDGERTIDVDAAADASAASQTEKPKFYAEQAQQTEFVCLACDHWNDILGRFGYCSSCGTRNDLAHLEAVISAGRAKAEGGSDADLYAGVRDLVSAFETMAQTYAEQLKIYVPLTDRRRKKLPNLFHDFARTAQAFEEVFDIPITKGMGEGDVKFAVMMFERRHVYEHKGGEADEKYLEDSGDTSVRPKQIIRETRENVHRLATLIGHAGCNLHEGFHELLPPESGPIDMKKEMDRFRPPPRR